MTETEIRKMLASALKAAGGLRSWARAHGVTASYVSSVMHGRSRADTPRILAALGLVRRVTIEPRRRA